MQTSIIITLKNQAMNRSSPGKCKMEKQSKDLGIRSYSLELLVYVSRICVLQNPPVNLSQPFHTLQACPFEKETSV